ncbi:hypothetical protein BT93_F1590 [Corymbia citriodora subsp. variegata]|nr:hypothetical protein BT93_F1590 [Corymbia citriodora subsp. variegata]
MVEESERTRLGSENEEGEGEIQGSRNKWLERYSPHHLILLVGEGDFSFSSSLAPAFGSASNITATSLDHYDALTKKYKKAKSNLWNLEKLGASVLLGVDATKMKYYPDLSVRKFDRIIFNFPHAGFYGKEDNVHLIEMHRTLISAFFHNASQMLRPDGEVHVNHKTTYPYCRWNLGELASLNSLKLIDQKAFESKNYPGYHHKRGDGRRCDEPFFLGPCSTFKFSFSPGARKALTELMHNNAIHGEHRPIYESPVQVPVEFPPIHERSVQVHGGSNRILNLCQIQRQSERILNLCQIQRQSQSERILNSCQIQGQFERILNLFQTRGQSTCHSHHTPSAWSRVRTRGEHIRPPELRTAQTGPDRLVWSSSREHGESDRTDGSD